MAETFDDLKAGDQVWVVSRGAEYLRTVEKTTPTRLTVYRRQFKKSDGREYGARDLYSRWHLARQDGDVIKAREQSRLAAERRREWEDLARSVGSLTTTRLVRLGAGKLDRAHDLGGANALTQIACRALEEALAEQGAGDE